MMLEELLEEKQKELLESQNSLSNLELNYQLHAMTSSFGGGETEIVLLADRVDTLEAEIEAYTKMKKDLLSDNEREILITGKAEVIRDFLLDDNLSNDYFVLSRVKQDGETA